MRASKSSAGVIRQHVWRNNGERMARGIRASSAIISMAAAASSEQAA